jgi:ABC-type branched-subunit amino acid transport system substrate-binding protein
MILAATTKMRTRPQVFLSYSMSDRQLAAKIAVSLEDAGLRVVRPEDLEPGHEYSNAVRDGLLKSAAMVVVLTQNEMPARVLFEIGAAFGAEKPIFVVVDAPSTRLPFDASKVRVLPMSRIEEIADELLS